MPHAANAFTTRADALPSAAPGVVCRAVDDGAVLLAMPNEVYFGLNAVGLRVWDLLPPASATLDELCATLADEYPEVDPSVVRADVTELLAELASHGLVVPPAQTRPAA